MRISISAYDVIKDMILQIMINLAPTLTCPNRQYNVSMYQILSSLDQCKVIGQRNQIVSGFFFIRENWLVGMLTNMAPAWRFSKL